MNSIFDVVDCYVVEEHQAKGDADTIIVCTVIDEEEKGFGATVIGDDSNLLVLLIIHVPANNQLKMVMPKKGNQQEKVHSIRDIQRGIGQMKNVLLVIYAFTGCDTVSAIYRKGKIVTFKKFKPTRSFLRRFLDSMIQT
ncbi:hypothetical protein AVEN_199704-1 [Araneus ventricosus]|uniref:Uncharacterized protein n=1 Tax=Araneus ventricosus TaxID=182803 RepID=A0A4Y2GWR1_ARAVE|nr:hypothetical protein AVEN_199704-1 [Araneus ventricosus]